MNAGKEEKSYVTDAITLDILQAIAENLMISTMEIEEMYLHVNYAKILDIQQSHSGWIEEFSIEIKILEGKIK